MSLRPSALPLAAVLLAGSVAAAPHAGAQGVIVDQGRFAILVDGREVGSEEFVIRRAGLGAGDALFASGVVSITAPERQEIRPLLRAHGATGTSEEYQATITGKDAAEIRIALGTSRRRYVATVRSAMGAEEREFQARDTRFVEAGVAHHYYFLRGEREGRDLSVLEPRSRLHFTLRVGVAVEEELRLGPNVVDARRVDFTADDGSVRTVWYDRQGRVLRVEIPAQAWVAERTDLVG